MPRLCSPPTSMNYILTGELSVQRCDRRGKHRRTCTRARTHKHTMSKMIPAIPLVFSFGFARKKQISLRKTLAADFVAQHLPRPNRQSSSELFMQQDCREKGSASACEGGLFTYLPRSRLFDLFETARFMTLGQHVTVSPFVAQTESQRWCDKYRNCNCWN